MLPLDHFLQSSDPLHVTPDGQMLLAGGSPRGLFPGSFNPLHSAHWELLRLAEQVLQHPVVFELSVANVDKPRLTREEIRRRLTQFSWRASVWLTFAPRFIEKATWFPGTTFVVGADTALRIVLPAYYNQDEAQMLAALARLQELNCRFLVACRLNAQGQCLQLEDLPIPANHRDLFQGIPPERFRWDLSSTQLRARGYKW